MHDRELTRQLAARSEITLERARAVVQQFKAIVRQEVAAGREVYLTGLGKFTTRRFPHRTRVSHFTGQIMDMPARRIPRFQTSPVWRRQAVREE